MPEEDTRPVAELLAAATDWTRDGGNGDWWAVSALQGDGSGELLAQVLKLAEAPDPGDRARAADILGQFGMPERTFPRECLDAVMRLLDTDPNPRVLRAAATALGHLKDARGTDPLVALIGHSDDAVRRAVAFALGGRCESKAVDALIHLMDDADPEIRDWATFGLGNIEGMDTKRIADALARHLGDADEGTRYEAMCGLARRGDLRTLEPLINAIMESPENYALWLPASALLGLENEELTADQLVPGLRGLRPRAAAQ